MKNFLTSILFAILISGCNQVVQSKTDTQSKSLTFSSLDSIHSKSKTEIEKYLKHHDFKFLNSDNEIYSWKSKKNNDIVHFSGTGAFTFMTESKSEFDTFTNEIKSKKYENTNIQDSETIKILTFTKDEKAILLTLIPDYENGKSMFSITFI